MRRILIALAFLIPVTVGASYFGDAAGITLNENYTIHIGGGSFHKTLTFKSDYDEAGGFSFDTRVHDGFVDMNCIGGASPNHWTGCFNVSTQDDIGGMVYTLGARDSEEIFTGISGGLDFIEYIDATRMHNVFRIDGTIISLPKLTNIPTNNKLIGASMKNGGPVGSINIGKNLQLSTSTLSTISKPSFDGVLLKDTVLGTCLMFQLTNGVFVGVPQTCY